mgnify:CR=1 FL=1
MYQNVGNNEIEFALDCLIQKIGIKALIDISFLNIDQEKIDFATIAKRISIWMGLPVIINLQTTSPGMEGRHFRSSGLGTFDEHGNANHEITAQVLIPPNIPPYGSESLSNCRIEILINPKNLSPFTFSCIIAHEFSHILLHSIKYEHKDSELYTDLVPILMGLSEVVSSGRKSITNHYERGQSITSTTTYGYLSDENFEFARKYYHKKINEVSPSMYSVKQNITVYKNELKEVRIDVELLEYCKLHLDSAKPKNMSSVDAETIVKIHNINYLEKCYNTIEKHKNKIEHMSNYISDFHYISSEDESIAASKATNLKLNIDSIRTTKCEIQRINHIILKHIPFWKKFKIYFKIRQKYKNNEVKHFNWIRVLLRINDAPGKSISV